MANIDRSTIWPYDERGEPREFFYQRNGDPTGAAVAGEGSGTSRAPS